MQALACKSSFDTKPTDGTTTNKRKNIILIVYLKNKKIDFLSIVGPTFEVIEHLKKTKTEFSLEARCHNAKYAISYRSCVFSLWQPLYKEWGLKKYTKLITIFF